MNFVFCIQVSLAEHTIMNSDKFCLKWSDFQKNIATSLHELQEDPDFSDVTLVCEEDKQIEAHRVILSAGSPFFRSVLKKNQHQHPMIYMRNMNERDLMAIIEFIYHGETNIGQEDLDSFLALAAELQLKGLTGSKEENYEEKKNSNELQPEPTHDQKPNLAPKVEYESFENTLVASSLKNQSIVPANPGKILRALNSNNEVIQNQIDTMLETVTDGDYKWKCTVCGKPSKDRRDIRRHIESHIDGLSYPCEKCGKISRSSNVLHAHVFRTKSNIYFRTSIGLIHHTKREHRN